MNNKPCILVKHAIQAFFQNTGLIFTRICLFSLVSCFLFCKRADFPLIYVVESFRPAIAGEYKLAQANRECSIEKIMPNPTETTLCVPILILIVYGFLGSRMYLFMLCRCFLQYFHGSDRNTSHTSPIWPTPH